MLNQINILRDPLSSGGGSSTTVVANSNNGQTLSGQLVEGDDNFAPEDNSGSDGDNIFDLGQFQEGKVSIKPDSESNDSDKPTRENAPPNEKLPKKFERKKEPVVEEEIENKELEVTSEEEEVTEEVLKEGSKENNKVDKRDYTGYSKEDVEYLKKLPNSIYNHVAPLLKKIYDERASWKPREEEFKKYKEDPNRIPDNWYEHPNAYTLSPKFSELNSLYSRADYESNHWQEQLISLRTSKSFIPIASYDTKTGEYKMGDEIKDLDDVSVARLEVQIQQAINKANILKQGYNTEAEKLKSEFGNQHGSINTYYDKADEMIKTLPAQFHPKDEHMKKFEAVLHPAHKGTGVGKLLSKMYSIIINQGIALAENTKNKQTTIKNNLDNKAAGPKSKVSSSSKPSKMVKSDDDEEIDFNKLKQEIEG